MDNPKDIGQKKNVIKKQKAAEELLSPFITEYKLTAAKRRKLMEVLLIPTLYGREALVTEYITKFCEQQGLAYITDNYRSVLITEGQLWNMEYYPMVGVHLETIQHLEPKIIKDNKGILTIWSEYNRQIN